MMKSRFKIRRLAFALLVAPAGFMHAAPSGTVIVYELSAFVPPADKITIFGVPFRSDEMVKVVVGTALPAASASRTVARSVNGKKSVPDTPVEPQRRTLEYGRALQRVPFEMITSSWVMIGGERFTPGASFEITLPLAYFVDAAVPDAEASIPIRCRFSIVEIRGGTLLLQVAPDDRYPAYNGTVAFKLQ